MIYFLTLAIVALAVVAFRQRRQTNQIINVVRLQTETIVKL